MAFPPAVPLGTQDGQAGGEPMSPPAPARMPLRDAMRGAEGDANKIVHLVPGEEVDDAPGAGNGLGDDDAPDEPPRPPAGGSRPSLKRIK